MYPDDYHHVCHLCNREIKEDQPSQESGHRLWPLQHIQCELQLEAANDALPRSNVRV